MNIILTLSFLFLLAPFTWASSSCFEGEWHLDIKQSDNTQKIKDRLLRKYKQDQRATYRAKTESEPEINLPAGIPSFLFFTDPLFIVLDRENISLKQTDVERKVNMQGHSQGLSLKDLNNQGGTTVAGWEGGQLVIETTSIDGTLIKESYQLLNNDHLLVSIVINTTVARPINMKKSYHREFKAPACILPEKSG